MTVTGITFTTKQSTANTCTKRFHHWCLDGRSLTPSGVRGIIAGGVLFIVLVAAIGGFFTYRTLAGRRPARSEYFCTSNVLSAGCRRMISAGYSSTLVAAEPCSALPTFKICQIHMPFMQDYVLRLIAGQFVSAEAVPQEQTPEERALFTTAKSRGAVASPSSTNVTAAAR